MKYYLKNSRINPENHLKSKLEGAGIWCNGEDTSWNTQIPYQSACNSDQDLLLIPTSWHTTLQDSRWHCKVLGSLPPMWETQNVFCVLASYWCSPKYYQHLGNLTLHMGALSLHMYVYGRSLFTYVSPYFKQAKNKQLNFLN